MDFNIFFAYMDVCAYLKIDATTEGYERFRDFCLSLKGDHDEYNKVDKD